MRHVLRRIFLTIVSVVIFSGPCLAATGSPVKMGIVTGGPTGTYYQFGLNLEELVRQNGVELNVSNSNGSVENIYAVFQRPNTQLGIVQSDVLAFVSRVQTNAVLKKIARKIKMVYPLYNEEVHLLGRDGLTNFADLAGKRVAIGKEGSGTFLTAKLLFQVSGIMPAEMVTIGSDEALEQLKAGNVDAMFYVAGYPVKLFSENVATDDNLSLLAIENTAITEFYPPGPIPAGTYSWQNSEVRSVAVKSVLVSFNFRASHCKNVGKFAQVMEDNMDWLKDNGHPKWNSVDLDYPLKGWEQYDCVAKYRTKRAPKPIPQELNPVLNAIKDIL